MTDDSTAPENAFSIPADPAVIDGDANDDGQADIGNASADDSTEENAA